MTKIEQLVYFSKKLYSLGLVSGTSGNISFRDAEKATMWITPSALPYDVMTVEDLVEIDLATGETVTGHRKPSSEKPMHQSIYNRRENIGAIVHTHSTYATMFACAGMEIPPVHYLLADIGDSVPIAPYATYGSEELAQYAVEAMDNANGTLLQNHGVIAVGSDLLSAFQRAEIIENMAQLAWGASALGSLKLLSDKQMAEARTGFSTYFPK
ncbi:class II aldolase/adducin family protein [Paenibacillus sp. GCM10027626]|uniref:class II aldolase/adducin family protein n=1 Tax=Paenibacillus sp. GCM10027626 TaxID=3273411 RepID=UPI00363E16BB